MNEGHLYIPEDHGWINLVEPIDKDRVITEIWPDWTLLDIPSEGITLREQYFVSIFISNNEAGWIFLIEDAPWVDGKLREVIEDNLDP